VIVWLNGAYGSGKTSTAFELSRRLNNAYVYDPENAGYFIRKNIPKTLHKSNFQDHEQWRTFNLELIKYIAKSYDGTIIIPMTLINPIYYNEIIGKLHENNIDVQHYILYANKEMLIKRLNKRAKIGESWAKSQIDNCIKSFNENITESKIYTDKLSIEEVVEIIAQKSNLSLLKDRRSKIKKLIDRIVVLIKHIRL
jgi:2-phosphoglycerate kinase